MTFLHSPFVLSLSKDFAFYLTQEGKGFDKLSPNGWGVFNG